LSLEVTLVLPAFQLRDLLLQAPFARCDGFKIRVSHKVLEDLCLMGFYAM
jgi:hypothetical protein